MFYEIDKAETAYITTAYTINGSSVNFIDNDTNEEITLIADAEKVVIREAETGRNINTIEGKMIFKKGAKYRVYTQALKEAAISPIECIAVSHKMGKVKFQIGNTTTVCDIVDDKKYEVALLNHSVWKKYFGISTADVVMA